MRENVPCSPGKRLTSYTKGHPLGFRSPGTQDDVLWKCSEGDVTVKTLPIGMRHTWRERLSISAHCVVERAQHLPVPTSSHDCPGHQYRPVCGPLLARFVVLVYLHYLSATHKIPLLVRGEGILEASKIVCKLAPSRSKACEAKHGKAILLFPCLSSHFDTVDHPCFLILSSPAFPHAPPSLSHFGS